MAVKKKPQPPFQIFDVADDTRDSKRPVAAIIHGYDKAGKTSFAGTFPNPFFVVPLLERGTISLKGVLKRMPEQKIKFATVASIAEMETVCTYIGDHHKEHDWRTVVLDPFTTYGTLVELELRQSWGGGDMRAFYGLVRRHLLNVWNYFQGVGLHAVFVFHSEGRDNDDGDVVLSPSLIGGAINIIRANVDLTVYIEAREVEQKNTEGETIYANGIAVTKTVRGVWVKCPSENSPQFIARSRFEEELTETVYKPNWKEAFAPKLKDVALVD